MASPGTNWAPAGIARARQSAIRSMEHLDGTRYEKVTCSCKGGTGFSLSTPACGRGRPTLARQAKACPTNAAQPHGNGQTPDVPLAGALLQLCPPLTHLL